MVITDFFLGRRSVALFGFFLTKTTLVRARLLLGLNNLPQLARHENIRDENITQRRHV